MESQAIPETQDDLGPTLRPGDVVVQIQQEKVAEPGDVVRLIALARRQQRRYVVVLVDNSEGLRWLALSLES